jgi:hypothetical protein
MRQRLRVNACDAGTRIATRDHVIRHLVKLFTETCQTTENVTCLFCVRATVPVSAGSACMTRIARDPVSLCCVRGAFARIIVVASPYGSTATRYRRMRSGILEAIIVRLWSGAIISGSCGSSRSWRLVAPNHLLRFGFTLACGSRPWLIMTGNLFVPLFRRRPWPSLVFGSNSPLFRIVFWFTCHCPIFREEYWGDDNVSSGSYNVSALSLAVKAFGVSRLSESWYLLMIQGSRNLDVNS